MTTAPGEPSEFFYLSLQDAPEIDAAIIEANADQAADELRSRDGLEGALGRPASYAHYEQAGLALQATVLAHGIAETQPFVDGNKPTRSSRCSPSWRSTGIECARTTENSPTGSSASAAASPHRTSQT